MGISLSDAQQVFTDQGLRTQYGLTLPPGARVAAYVRSTGVQSGDDAFLNTNMVPTLALGLARVRAGLGDFVVVLPGHVENVTDATTFSSALLAGTKIIGVGKGGNTPTFTWTTATTARWTVNVADVSIIGLRLVMDGINAVQIAINVTAADFGFYYNEVEVGNAAGSAICNNAITLAAGSTRFDITGNIFRSGPVPASGCIPINVTGAVSDGRICDNEMMCSGSSSLGCIDVSAAAVNIKILRNVINNNTPTSVAAIAFANVAISGHCAYNTMTVLSTGVVSAGVTGITVGGASNTCGYFQNFCVNDVNKSGLLVPAVDT